MGIRSRFAEAVRAGRTAVREADLARLGAGGARPHEEARPESLGALVVGLTVEEIAAAGPAIRGAARAADAFTVLITDRTEIAVYQMKGLVTEYLPPLAALDGAGFGRDGDLYLRRRLALIGDKWNLRRILVFGPEAGRLAQQTAAGRTGLPPQFFAAGDGASALQI